MAGIEFWTPCPLIRHVEVEGLRIVLDIGRESYNVLDEPASLMWSTLIGERGAEEAFLIASTEFDVDLGRWTTDLANFSARCEQSGLLARTESPLEHLSTRCAAPAGAGNKLPFLRALDHLLDTRRVLKRTGFCLAYRAYSEIPSRSSGKPLAPLLSAFGMAENLFITRRAPRDCLLRSLSLFRFLRSFGMPVEHVIGVRRFPFQAHAWVEHRGLPLLDDRAAGFTAISRIAAPSS